MKEIAHCLWRCSRPSKLNLCGTIAFAVGNVLWKCHQTGMKQYFKCGGKHPVVDVLFISSYFDRHVSYLLVHIHVHSVTQIQLTTTQNIYLTWFQKILSPLIIIDNDTRFFCLFFGECVITTSSKCPQLCYVIFFGLGRNISLLCVCVCLFGLHLFGLYLCCLYFCNERCMLNCCNYV